VRQLFELFAAEGLISSSRARKRRESRDRTLPTFEPTPFGAEHGRFGAGSHVIEDGPAVGEPEPRPCRTSIAAVARRVIRRLVEQDRVG
jgi:hypothetical protein